jgi:hypothetical protein
LGDAPGPTLSLRNGHCQTTRRTTERRDCATVRPPGSVRLASISNASPSTHGDHAAACRREAGGWLRPAHVRYAWRRAFPSPPWTRPQRAS